MAQGPQNLARNDIMKKKHYASGVKNIEIITLYLLTMYIYKCMKRCFAKQIYVRYYKLLGGTVRTRTQYIRTKESIGELCCAHKE